MLKLAHILNLYISYLIKNKVITMDHINVDGFKELAKVREPECISIFIPTHRAGQEVIDMLDQKHLKNKVKSVRDELNSWHLQDHETAALLEPIRGLIDDSGFWKKQSDGLAIFRSRNFFEYYTLPAQFEPYEYIADHFYTLPLIPYINNEEVNFYLLAISQGGVRFFEGSMHSINEVMVDDLLPERLEEVVGFDFEDKQLQYRAANDDRGRATYHGHGKSNEEVVKKEIHNYFRAVDKGLKELLNDKKEPLILAAVDYLVPLYREVNGYKYLHKNFIPGSPDHENPKSLHEKARSIIEEYAGREKKQKAEAFEGALSEQKASFKEEVIIPAAVNKKIDTLFVKKGEEVWGMYDKDNHRIIKRDKELGQSSGLLNLAATHTIFNNGRVYLTDADEMPEPISKLNAIFRY